MKKRLNDLCAFLIKHKGMLINSLVLACISYGSRIFSLNIGIDTEYAIMYPSEDLQWLGVGRQGLTLLKYLFFDYQLHPYLSGIIMVVLLLFQTWLWTYMFYWLSGKDEKYPYWLFACLYTTSQIWFHQFYFTLQRGEVAIASTLTVIAVVCTFYIWEGNLTKFKKVIAVVALFILQILICSSYQVLAVLYIAGIMGGVWIKLQRMEKEENNDISDSNKNSIIFSVKAALLFVAAFAVNSYITNKWFSGSSYYATHVAWRTDNICGGITSIIRHIGAVVYAGLDLFLPMQKILPLSYTMADFATVIVVAACMIIVFFIIEAVHIIGKRGFKEKINWLWQFVLFLGILSTPFWLTCYMGKVAETRTQIPLVFAAAFLAMVVVRKINLLEKTKLRCLLQWFFMFVFVIGIWYQVKTTLLLQYTDDIRYQQDVQMMHEIVEDIRSIDSTALETKAVVFVGGRDTLLNPTCIKSGLIGRSFFYHDFDPVVNRTATTERLITFYACLYGYEPAWVSEQEEIENVCKLSAELPLYPQDGYIMITDTMIVVKLSNIN